MALVLENYLECVTWDEWTEHIKRLNMWRNRNSYYPDNMDMFYDNMKFLENQRRLNVEKVMNERDKMALDYSSFNEEEKILYKEYHDAILKEQIAYNVHGGNFKVNMQIIIDLQDDRLQALKEMSGIRTLKEFMRNIQIEEDKPIVKQNKLVSPKKEKRLKEKLLDKPLRRSKRLLEKGY